jgi:hypothetical protein
VVLALLKHQRGRERHQLEQLGLQDDQLRLRDVKIS